MERFLSAAQVAKRFNVTSRTVVRWIDEGLFPGAFKANPDVTNSPYLIPVLVVDKFAEERKNEETEEPSKQNGLEANIV